ncbi:MAG: secretin N-terminal domain-containing protein, partial [Planctomycetota bacterium]
AVVAKSPDNLAVIDQIIRDLDQPKSVGLPAIVSLKHVSAEEVAEQLNALLALDGTLASIPRSETGLSSGAGAGESPFADDATDTGAADTENDPGTITFWWQTAQEQNDTAGPSNLIGKLRIVPVWRQNAIMVLSPPEYRAAIVDLIQQLDQPGRQVLIQAVIAEVSRDDAEALGLRWSSSAINLSRTDNSISFISDFSGTENNLLDGLFDTSVLNVGVDLNAVLQALNERTNVSILSRPIVFTSDNQEAEFFDGQDIPFITNAQTTDTGGTTQGFEYRAVGIQLRVRPRLTPNRDVDLRVNIELSSVAPGQNAQSGQVVVDRRETTTQLIVRSGQTLVISGILRNEDSDVVRKVPLLGDIPLLGWLFRSRETSVNATEQLIFITPVVVENGDEADELNESYRERLRIQREQMGIEEPLEGELPTQPLDSGEGDVEG